MKNFSFHVVDVVDNTIVRQKSIYGVTDITVSKADIDGMGVWRPSITSGNPRGILFKVRDQQNNADKIILSAIDWKKTIIGGYDSLASFWYNWLSGVSDMNSVAFKITVKRIFAKFGGGCYKVEFECILNNTRINSYDPSSNFSTKDFILQRTNGPFKEFENEFLIDGSAELSSIPIEIPTNVSLLDYALDDLLLNYTSKVNGKWVIYYPKLPKEVTDAHSIEIVTQMKELGFKPIYRDYTDAEIEKSKSLIEFWELGVGLIYRLERLLVDKFNAEFVQSGTNIRASTLSDVPKEDLVDCLRYNPQYGKNMLNSEMLINKKNIRVVDILNYTESTKRVMLSKGFEPVYSSEPNPPLLLAVIPGYQLVGWAWTEKLPIKEKPSSKIPSSKVKLTKLSSFPLRVLSKYLVYEYELDRYVLSLEKLMDEEDCVIGSGNAFSKSTSIEMIKKGFELYHDKKNQFCRKYNGCVKSETGNNFIWVYNHHIEGEPVGGTGIL